MARRISAGIRRNGATLLMAASTIAATRCSDSKHDLCRVIGRLLRYRGNDSPRVIQTFDEKHSRGKQISVLNLQGNQWGNRDVL